MRLRHAHCTVNLGLYACRSTNTLIEDAVILNGDDAITVENGANNVTIRNILMGGPGSHGMSVGSLGQNQATYNKVNNSEPCM